MLNSKDLGSEMNLKRWIGLCTLLFALTGCGSGREDFASQDPSAKAVSLDAFNIQAGWARLVKNGFSKSLYARGSCSGYFQMTLWPARAYGDGTFAFIGTQVTDWIYIYCGSGTTLRPSSNTVQTNFYVNTYENSYTEIGTNFGVWVPEYAGNAHFPSSAKVGDTGTIGTVRLYDAREQLIGQEVWTYAIEQETATTAIFRLTKATQDASTPPAWIATQEEQYRANTKGDLELLAISQKHADGFAIEAK